MASSDPAGPQGPLLGLTVLELPAGRAGTFAGTLLADLGADVIKVEPTTSSVTRTLPASEDVHRLALDRSKRSLRLDLDHPRSREVLGRLVGRADVLVDEADAATLTALGLDEPALRAANPDLVHCTVTGTGNGASLSAPDAVIQALSGCVDLTGHAGGAPY